MNEQRDQQIRTDRESGMGFTELHRRYGLSITQLHRIAGDIKVRHAHPNNNPQWIGEQLGSGATARAMAAEAGVPIGTMNYWIREFRGTAKKRPQSTLGECSLTEDWDNREWFDRKYGQELLGIPSIAKLLGRSVGFVSGRLKRYGIQTRNLKSAMAGFRVRPDLAWCREHYDTQKLSISACAELAGVRYNTMLDALTEYGITLRSASEQHQGELNSFHGKQHPEATRVACATAGMAAGAAYWETGDVEAKKLLASILSKETWSDPVRRQQASERIAKLCQEGKCSPKSCPYLTNSGDLLLLRSSWESAVAKYLDSCSAVATWQYEHSLIQYLFEEDVHTFVVDFTINWVDGAMTYLEVKNEYLSGKPKEAAKLGALREHAQATGTTTILIQREAQVKELLRPYVSPAEYVENRYEVKRTYLTLPELAQEALVHELVAHSTPWSAPRYSEEELRRDLERLLTENLGGYHQDGVLKSTASNSGGMPGKPIILQHQPHFWDVAVRRVKPLPLAFRDRIIVEKCIRISISESESLSTDRLCREITHHFPAYGRTSHFAAGFARNLLRLLEVKRGMRLFDPCCGWGGRLLAAYAEGLSYEGCDLSEPTVAGLRAIAQWLGFPATIHQHSCLELPEWPGDVVVTSPPFYDVERYLGTAQPWQLGTRADWVEQFVRPFAARLAGKRFALYLDAATLADFRPFLPDARVLEVRNRRHSRRQVECEYLLTG